MSTLDYTCEAVHTFAEMKESFKLNIHDIEEAADNWTAADEVNMVAVSEWNSEDNAAAAKNVDTDAAAAGNVEAGQEGGHYDWMQRTAW